MAKTGERRLVSKSEYARHRAVSPAMVTYYGKAGRLVLVDKLVDLEATDALLNAALDPTRGGKGGRPRMDRQDAPPTPGVVTETPMSRATAADREASTALKRLRLERESGRVVNREAFVRATEAAFASVRDALLIIPIKLQDQLAAESDPRRCMELLRREIEVALNEEANLQEALAEQPSATSQ